MLGDQSYKATIASRNILQTITDSGSLSFYHQPTILGSNRPGHASMTYYPTTMNPDYTCAQEAYRYNNTLNRFPSPYSLEEQDISMTDPCFMPMSQAGVGNLPTAVDGWPTYNTTPFGEIGELFTAFTPASSPRPRPLRPSPLQTPDCVSPTGTHAVPSYNLKSVSRSPSSHENGSPYSEVMSHHSEEEVTAEPAPRKRGRPRLTRCSTPPADSYAHSTKPRRTTTCLPHKQVERKYREGLNMEFERLRRAIPTLPQSVDAHVMGAAKPSKGMVLAAAIEYINKTERERDAAFDEIERLGGKVRMSKVEKSWGAVRSI